MTTNCMHCTTEFINIQDELIVGINYSGMHDTAISVVSLQGEILFSVSLERVSRWKQDGRSPAILLDGIPWDKVSQVAFSVEGEYLKADSPSSSKFHDMRLLEETSINRGHMKAFYDVIDSIPAQKIFVPHHLCHAASAFWLSSFSDAVCLVYDGGMSNEDVFGGVFFASRDRGVASLDVFDADKYGNVTHVYSAITAILGFSPMKHEGKITGLAAYGKPRKGCMKMLDRWMESPELTSGLVEWICSYSDDTPPKLSVMSSKLHSLQEALSQYSREDIAASVQKYAEDHVISILESLAESSFSENLCLSGGLFANVKINQRVRSVYKNVFISPPMSDDGTALGAAMHAASFSPVFSPKPCHSMYLGPDYSDFDTLKLLTDLSIKYSIPEDPSLEIAKLLSSGQIVAIYQGASEFGPRSLGNRSILASADDVDINRKLNNLLGRTEFMPFAPMCLSEDADRLFEDMDGIRHTSEFMTITVNCSAEMKEQCPAVVHCDGTARPQLVLEEANPLIYNILKNYKHLHSKPALVNTSFNIHEEPIVCSPEDALRGFFEGGLDYLYINGILVELKSNSAVQVQYLKKKITHLQGAVRQNSKDILTSREKRKKSIQNRKKMLTKFLRAQSSLKLEIASISNGNRRLVEESQKINQAYLDIYHSTSWRILKKLHPFIEIFQSVFKARELEYGQLEFSNPDQKELVVDITHIHKNDLKTGIQRVSRAVVEGLGQTISSEEFLVRKIFLDRKGLYRYCDDNELVVLKKGDIFLGLDLNSRVCDVENIFSTWSERKVKVVFVVYDILPIMHPHWWSEDVFVAHNQWLRMVLRYSDKVACISKTVANDVVDYSVLNSVSRISVDQIRAFSLGADIENSQPSKGLPEGVEVHRKMVADQVTFLMVGTVEPRKGYREVLDSFDELWRLGYEINLVIVGKKGWMMDDFLTKVESHKKRDVSLFYYNQASDEFLEELYDNSTCLIAASEAEGFGLPLIEAAMHNLPIIARDTPIFREVAGEHAMYFSSNELPQTILKWIDLYKLGKHIGSHNMEFSTWSQSIEELLDIMEI